MKDKKLPALQFYPGDWRKDMGVQSLSFHDRGVWFEMLMLMHDSERRGVLVLNGKAMSDEMIARAIGLDNQMFNQTLTTLLTNGVAGREQETGAVINRRMVRDEYLRKIRADAGSKGGNPVLLNQIPTTLVKQKPTPSSSVSLSIKKPSRKPKASSDTRHQVFKEAIQRYWDSKNQGLEMPWGPQEGKQLGMWLGQAPNTTIEQFTAFLRNRFKSEVNHTERPSRWIGSVTGYAAGPLDRFGKPLNVTSLFPAQPTAPSQYQLDVQAQLAEQARLRKEAGR